MNYTRRFSANPIAQSFAVQLITIHNIVLLSEEPYISSSSPPACVRLDSFGGMTNANTYLCSAAAGADIKEMAKLTFSEAYQQNKFSEWERVGKIRKPVS